MARNSILKRHQEELEDDFSFFEDMESAGNEAIAGMMSSIAYSCQKGPRIPAEVDHRFL